MGAISPSNLFSLETQLARFLPAPVENLNVKGCSPIETSGWQPIPMLRARASAEWMQAVADQSENRLEVGLRARDWGVSNPQVNPDTDTYDWSNSSLSWARRGLERETGRRLKVLRADNAQEALANLKRKGRIYTGEAPAGALVFVGDGESGYKVGFANPDGRTYRTTVPPTENPRTIGDRPLPSTVAWALPASLRVMPTAATSVKKSQA